MLALLAADCIEWKGTRTMPLEPAAMLQFYYVAVGSIDMKIKLLVEPNRVQLCRPVLPCVCVCACCS